MHSIDRDRTTSAHPDTLGLTRRGVLTALFPCFVVCAFAGVAAAARPSRRMPARDWIDRQDELARALRQGRLSLPDWMHAIESLAREIDVDELMASVDVAALAATPAPRTNDPRKRTVRFFDASGAPRRLAYAAAVFDFAPGNVVTPHGHRHMASAHLVIAGSLRVRNFDRLRDEASGLLIRPTRDAILPTGALSAMSSARDNVHWFVPHRGPAGTFDLVISGLDPGAPDHAIDAIDPLGGERRADGTILAPRIGFAQASAKYTAAV